LTPGVTELNSGVLQRMPCAKVLAWLSCENMTATTTSWRSTTPCPTMRHRGPTCRTRLRCCLGVLSAEVPDEDPLREPTIHFDPRRDHAIPFEVMRWFMGRVADEVERCHAAMEAGPESEA
jgi:hypothetical protein